MACVGLLVPGTMRPCDMTSPLFFVTVRPLDEASLGRCVVHETQRPWGASSRYHEFWVTNQNVSLSVYSKCQMAQGLDLLDQFEEPRCLALTPKMRIDAAPVQDRSHSLLYKERQRG
jgi:hypothetical protein